MYIWSVFGQVLYRYWSGTLQNCTGLRTVVTGDLHPREQAGTIVRAIGMSTVSIVIKHPCEQAGTRGRVVGRVSGVLVLFRYTGEVGWLGIPELPEHQWCRLLASLAANPGSRCQADRD